tara:strand:+ start:1062 stop:2555 length:1494 start_codon:yes stop_codon:yes gene_type:complete
LVLASLLDKSKQFLLFLIPFIFGILGVFAFAPFSIKFLIIPSYSYLIHLVFFTSDNGFIKKLILWTLGHWGIGVSWIIVSVYYYGNIGYTASAIVYLIFLSLILMFAVAPLRLFKIHEKYNLSLYSLAYIASALILIELTRDFFFGGFPWLVPGTTGIDTLLSKALPIFGVSSASFIIYFVAAYIAGYWNISKSKSVLILLISSLLFLPFNLKNTINPEDALKIKIVQPSIDIKIKQSIDKRYLIEKELVNLSKEDWNNPELLIWPEAELPFTYKSREYFELKELFSESTELVTGMWHFEGNLLFNSFVNIKNDEIYKKQHLVPFGEYIPLKAILNPILSYFGAPISDITPGRSNQEPISIGKDIKLAPLICYDIVFANDVRKAVKSSNLIVNISNDSWFGRSLGPYQHLEISRIRALENNKWLVRATNDGFSAIIDNKGTIVDLMGKGQKGSINSIIYAKNTTPIYALFGYYVPYSMAILYLLLTIGRFIWLKIRP